MHGFTAFPGFTDFVQEDIIEEPSVTYFHLSSERFPRLRYHHGQVLAPRHSCWFPGATESNDDDTAKVLPEPRHPKHVDHFIPPVSKRLCLVCQSQSPTTEVFEGLNEEGLNEDTNNTVPAIRPDGLMDIPIEIRDMIWHLVLKDEQHVPMMSLGASSATFRYFKDVVYLRWYRQHNYQSNPPFLPSICRLSNHTHAETVRTFLRGTMFVSSSIADNNSLTGFLASIPGGFASIRGLYFDYFGRLPPNVAQNMDLELAVRCTGLRELKILMHNDVLASRPAQVAWTYYHFNRLLDCGNVGKVTIATMGYYNVTAAGQTTRDLATLIENGFSSRGRTVEVVVD